MTDLKLSSHLRLILDRAASEAKRYGHGNVSPLHLFVAMDRGEASTFTDEERSAARAALKAISPTYERPVLSDETHALLAEAVSSEGNHTEALVDLVKSYINELPAPVAREADEHPDLAGNADDESESAAAAAEDSADDAHWEPSRQLRQVIAKASTDHPSVPRIGTVHRILAMLGARQPQPVLLVGREGSGRTTIAQAIAAALADEDYLGPLAGSPVWVTRSAAVGEQAQPLLGLSDLPSDHVLFVDDLELIFPLGRYTGGLGIPPLRSLLGCAGPRVVLCITEPDVDALISADPELMDELEVVHLPAMTDDEVNAVANAISRELQDYHGVVYPDDVLAAAAAPPRASDSHAHPALALRRLDRAGSAASMRTDRTARASDLGTEVAGQQYVAFDASRARVALGESVFGQDDAIRQVTERLAVTRASLDLRPERPDGVFLFAGPTGTGKTELARAMAREIFGAADALIRLDMSEFSEPHTVSKLIGSPPGYVGSTEPSGWLTTRIRQRPQSLLLLDEFEKAHLLVWNTFLQVFDAGVLTDSRGNKAEFSDTIIVLTSNVGARHFADKPDIGFLPSTGGDDASELAVREEIKRVMSPELLNRLDGILVFHPLAPSTIRSIARKNINAALSRLAERGILVDVSDALEDEVCAQGFSREYGARPLMRVVENLVVLPIAAVSPGSYTVDFTDGRPVVRALPS